MKIITKSLLAIGIACLFFGVLLFGVAMLTGGDLESVTNHGIAMPYLSSAADNVKYALQFITNLANTIAKAFVV